MLVRIYDSEKIEKLSEAYRQGNYENKNSFFNELIEHGITAKTKTEQRRTELDNASVGIEERLLALENQYAEFAKTVYIELETLKKDNKISHKVLGAMYYLLQSIYFNDTIVYSELDSGFYDDLPSRFGSSSI